LDFMRLWTLLGEILSTNSPLMPNEVDSS
jgi:hypothetical protein